MKSIHKTLLAIFACAASLFLIAAAGPTSLNRFIEWRYNPSQLAPWVCTNTTTGEGHWGTNISVRDVQIISANDSTWQITSPGDDNLWFTNAGLGVPLHFDVVNGTIRIPEGSPWQLVSIPTNLGVDSVIVTNNIGFKVGTVAGVGGANTNFTLQASGDESIIYVNAGTTNVNIVAIMGYSSTIAYRGTLILTNRTGTARTLSLDATTNNWISLQKYDGISAPFTVTNSQAGRLSWEILGTNVQYSYKPMDLPSN